MKRNRVKAGQVVNILRGILVSNTLYSNMEN